MGDYHEAVKKVQTTSLVDLFKHATAATSNKAAPAPTFNAETATLNALLPFLKGYGMVPKNATMQQIGLLDLKELCVHWKIKYQTRQGGYIPVKELLKLLHEQADRMVALEKRHQQEREETLQDELALLRENNAKSDYDIFGDPNAPLKAKFSSNYFGIGVANVTERAMLYSGRAPFVEKKKSALRESVSADAKRTGLPEIKDGKAGQEEEEEEELTGNAAAQTKVGHALMIMARNKQTIHHFVHKGGINAVYKMLTESKDKNVLSTSAGCLVEVTRAHAHAKTLLNKNILTYCNGLIEDKVLGLDEDCRYLISKVVFNLSEVEELEDMLIKFGVVVTCQTLSGSNRDPTVCFSLLALVNIATAFGKGPDSELVSRMLVNIAKRLDILTNSDHAHFIACLANDLSRLELFKGLLVEEGVLPILIKMINVTDNVQTAEEAVEALVQLSMARKNHREIAGSGIANELTKILDGDWLRPVYRAYTLLMLGNLLSAGYLFDKIARADIVQAIVSMLEPDSPLQFVAVSYCLCQIGSTPSNLKLVVECGALEGAVEHLFANMMAESLFADDKPLPVGTEQLGDATKARAIAKQAVQSGTFYLWALLTNICELGDKFIELAFRKPLADTLVMHLLREIKSKKDLRSGKQLPGSLIYAPLVVQLLMNVTQSDSFFQALSQSQLRQLCEALLNLLQDIDPHAHAYKCGFGPTSETSSREDFLHLVNRIHFNEADKTYFKVMDIRMKEGQIIAIKAASNEKGRVGPGAREVEILAEDLNIELDKPIRKQIVSVLCQILVHDVSMRTVLGQAELVKQFGIVGTADSRLNNKYLSCFSLISQDEKGCMQLYESGIYKFLVSMRTTLDDAGLDLLGLLFHNVSLKKAVLAPGMLVTLLELARGCKTVRAMWIVRTICNLSGTIKGRAALGKERKLVPLLSMMMRSGGTEADLVQRYGAIICCNVFSGFVDRSIIDTLIKNETIADLLVVTLLRVNSSGTKEHLGKALFNLLARQEFRLKMTDLNIVDALVELGKIELQELLELSVRTLYNIACEEDEKYRDRLTLVGAPMIIIGRITSNREIQGVPASLPIKSLCGQTLALMSCVPTLRSEICYNKDLPRALEALNSINMPDATLSVCVTAYKLSQIDPTSVRKLAAVVESKVKLVEEEEDTAPMNQAGEEDAKTCMVSTLVSIISRGPVLCTQLCLSALCNLSVHAVFGQQLIQYALKPTVNTMMTTIVAPSIKLDCLNLLHNVVTTNKDARAALIDAEAVPALVTLLKTMNDDSVVLSIGRIIKEVCIEAPLHLATLLKQDIMSIIFKLSKIEIAPLKLNIAQALFSLTKPYDEVSTAKLLKWDAIDTIFWLTVHDALKLYDPIKRVCARALMNFSVTKAEALVLVQEDRFITIMQELAKSVNEDCLVITATIVYNLISMDECRPTLVKRGGIPLIFQLAASNYESVRHICSASLHMAPDDMPDLEDEETLALVMALLDVKGDLFGSLGIRSSQVLEFPEDIQREGSPLEYQSPDKEPNWTSLVCGTDNFFTPAMVQLIVDHPSGVRIKPLESATMAFPKHRKFSSDEFHDFKYRTPEERGEVRAALAPPEKSDGDSLAMSSIASGGDRGYAGPGSLEDYSAEFEEDPVLDAWNVSAPEPSPLPPTTSPSVLPSGADDVVGRSRGNAIYVDSRGASGAKKIVPEDAGDITFPRIQNHRNKIPDDTLGAIKGALYKPPRRDLQKQANSFGASQTKPLDLGGLAENELPFYSKK
jgi:hypothetical protein